MSNSMVIDIQLSDDDDQTWRHLKPYQVGNSRFYWSSYMVFVFGKGSWKPHNCQREEMWELT